jgi:hypothetical protein
MGRKKDPVLDDLHKIREEMYRRNKKSTLEETSRAIARAARQAASRAGITVPAEKAPKKR